MVSTKIKRVFSAYGRRLRAVGGSNSAVAERDGKEPWNTALQVRFHAVGCDGCSEHRTRSSHQ